MKAINLFFSLIVCIASIQMSRGQDSSVSSTINQSNKAVAILPVEIAQGFIKSRGSSELYLLSLQFSPQWQKGRDGSFRAGFNLGALYYPSSVYAFVGPRVSYKIAHLPSLFKKTATTADLRIIAEMNFGSDRQKVIGAGLSLEILERCALALQANQDLEYKAFWLRAGIAIHLNKPPTRPPSDLDRVTIY